MPRIGEVATSIINTLLPSYVSGEQEAFWQVGGLVAEAVHYFNGDGGSIFVDRFPGLIRYLRVKGITIHSVNTPRCNPVYFREVFHDAIELGHQYTIAPVEDTDSLPGESNARPQVQNVRSPLPGACQEPGWQADVRIWSCKNVSMLLDTFLHHIATRAEGVQREKLLDSYKSRSIAKRKRTELIITTMFMLVTLELQNCSINLKQLKLPKRLEQVQFLIKLLKWS